MAKERWYVLTGGPRSGKTTVLELLAQKGYRTVSEAARTYIEGEFAKGKTIEEIRENEIEFQKALIEMKRATEQELPQDETIFFDRGMHDSEAYLQMRGVTDDSVLAEALSGASYRRVFLLDRLPYKQDSVRTETPEEAERIHALITEAYERAGIPLERIPVFPTPEERAAYLLTRIS